MTHRGAPSQEDRARLFDLDEGMKTLLHLSAQSEHRLLSYLLEMAYLEVARIDRTYRLVEDDRDGEGTAVRAGDRSDQSHWQPAELGPHDGD